MTTEQSAEHAAEVDIAIVGGGLVGASLALALRRFYQRQAQQKGSTHSLRVAVIEPFTPGTDVQPSYDDRTLVLNEVSGQIMQQLGLHDLLQQHGEPIRSIHVSDRGHPGRTMLRASEHQREAFGHVVLAREIGRAMFTAIEQANSTDSDNQDVHLQWWSPARLQQLQMDSDGVELQLDGAQQRLRCQLVIGADGADSMVRQQAGLPARQHDYRQTAIICNVTPQQHHGGCAFERFTDSGPLALLPQPGGRVGVVMCVDHKAAPDLLALTDEDFLRHLQQRFGQRLGQLQQIGKRASYPLRLLAAQQHIRQRVVLIGNAAHTIHPVSAQGFNLGLRDAWVLAATLTQFWAQPSFVADTGSITALLSNYQARRDSDQRETIRYTDSLARLYSNPSLPARLLRGGGLIGHQLLPGLQQTLVQRAMGYRSPLPDLPAVAETLQIAS